MPFITNENELQKHNVHQGKRTESLNYAKHVPDAPTLVTPGANPFYIIHNIQDTARWSLGMLQDGADAYGDDMRMGDRYFIKSGTCSNVTSVPDCQGQPRYLYIDNVPSESVPCADPNQPNDPKSAKMPEGLLAGVVQDIVGLNPFELMKSATGTGSVVNNACVLRRERVDSVYPYKRPRPRYETRCAPKREPLVCSLSSLKDSSCKRYSYADDDSETNKRVSQIRKKSSDGSSVAPGGGASAPSFALGEEVQADYKGRGRYLPATIKQKHDDGTYDLYYADVSESNRDMADVLDAMSSVDYVFRPIRAVDQKRMATNPHFHHWTKLVHTVNEVFRSKLRSKYNSTVEVHSHKHCLVQVVELEDRGGRKWLKMLWTNLYQINFESLQNVVCREHDHVEALHESGDTDTKTGRITKVNEVGGVRTYDIKFVDSTIRNATPEQDIVEMHYYFQAFWTACYNMSPATKGDKYYKGDRVSVRFANENEDAKIVEANSDGTYDLQLYDTAKTIRNGVQSDNIQTIDHLIISGDVIGNSYKSFKEEPKGYYVVGVREPFVADQPSATPFGSPHSSVCVFALFVAVIICVVAKIWLVRAR